MYTEILQPIIITILINILAVYCNDLYTASIGGGTRGWVFATPHPILAKIVQILSLSTTVTWCLPILVYRVTWSPFLNTE